MWTVHGRGGGVKQVTQSCMGLMYTGRLPPVLVTSSVTYSAKETISGGGGEEGSTNAMSCRDGTSNVSTVLCCRPTPSRIA